MVQGDELGMEELKEVKMRGERWKGRAFKGFKRGGRHNRLRDASKKVEGWGKDCGGEDGIRK